MLKIFFSRACLILILAATPVAVGATSLVSAAGYLPFGPLSGLSFGNAVTETWTHDASYRATGIADTGAGAVGKISSLGYTLDAADNVTAIVDNVTAANNQAFTYNTRDRLLTANGAYGAYTWTYYDYIGDRLSEQLGTATATTYGYYADLVTSVGSTKISYIGGGVVSAVTPATGAASTFTYNQANRLASATTGLGVEHYLYDGAGALFARGTIVAPVSVTQFQYDLDGRLLEEDSNNAAQADYIYLNNRPVAVYDPTHGIFSYLHDDRLGTPVKATSSAAATVWSAAYNPFGLIYAQSGSIVQDLRLPGQFADPVTGRYHNGWRDYNPAIGRYEEVDPLNRLAGWNVFGYADQNPLKNIDPSGLQVESDGSGREDNLFPTTRELLEGEPAGQSMNFTAPSASEPAEPAETPATIVNSPVVEEPTDLIETPTVCDATNPRGGPRPSPNFVQPVYPAQSPPTNLPSGYSVRVMGPTSQYPNGYFVITNQGRQPVDPITLNPPSNVTSPVNRSLTHVPLLPSEE